MKLQKLYFSLISLILITLHIIATDQKTNDAHKELVESMYANISGFNIDSSECSMIEKSGGAPTYGEITYEAGIQLLNLLNLNKNDVFYDLGSGAGKFVIQSHLTTPVKKAVGIELSPTRVKHALKIKDELEKRGKLDKQRVLDFKEQNITDALVDDATVVYMCSTCYSNTLMQKIIDKLALLKKGLRVVTLKKLPKHEKFKLIDTYHLPMTWSSKVSVSVYELVD